jgi:hypothetical protein
MSSMENELTRSWAPYLTMAEGFTYDWSLRSLQRTLQVDGAFALDVAVRAAAGREHDRVRVTQRGREPRRVAVLDIEQAGLGTERFELVVASIRPHERHRSVSLLHQQRMQSQGDLAVASD